jgi:uncharacterized protein YoxC
MNHDTIELACIGVGALALLLQAFVLLAIYFGVNKATRSLKDEMEELRSSVMPVLSDTKELVGSARTTLARISPKVESAVTDAAELARTLRGQAVQVDASLDEVLERVRRQASRIDGMFTGTMDAVDKAGVFVAEAVGKPVRQLSGLVASVKAMVESLRESSPAYREPAAHDDKDMFV